MSAKPWYAFYYGDYAVDTRDLSLAQHGAYRLLLDHYYAITGALPCELPQLWRLTGAVTEEEKAAVSFVVERFFVNGNNRLHNKRADVEIRKQADFLAEQSRKGKLSANVRWGNRSVTEPITEPITEGITERQPDCNLPQPQTITTTTTTNHKPQKTKTQRKDPLDLPPELPDWIPADSWRTYLQMRVRIKKPATPRTQRMLIGTLDELRDAGHLPHQVLALMESKCWTSIKEEWIK